MTEPTMIERVARALCEAAGNPPAAHDTTPSMSVPEGDVDWRSFVPSAQAALEAMREPTGFMTVFGYSPFSSAQGSVDPYAAIADIWRAMVNGALADEG